MARCIFLLEKAAGYGDKTARMIYGHYKSQVCAGNGSEIIKREKARLGVWRGAARRGVARRGASIERGTLKFPAREKAARGMGGARGRGGMKDPAGDGLRPSFHCYSRWCTVLGIAI